MTTQPDIPPAALTDAAADITRQFIAEHGFSPEAEEAMLIGRLAAAAIGAASPHIRADERERCAVHLEALAGNYPEDVFPPGSSSRDAIGGTAMRHAYRNAARSLRESPAATEGTGK